MTHPLTGKKYPAGYFDAETVETLLLLADVECADVSKWTQQQQAEAGNWALRSHLKASDNTHVRVPLRPEWVAA